MLKYNFFLSKWFTGKKQDKTISGTAFLFLIQISFLFIDVFLISMKLLSFTLSPIIATGIVMLVIYFIMFGLQKRMETKVLEQKYEKKFYTLKANEICKNRLIAFILFVTPFILCFIIIVLLY